ncbi:hypothetical protein [Winogradskya humida]|uniref:Uncharacterized protein n=1 Tax=Winogradskya humida TaxID=113566 RepID=A0ABQ4A2Q5_9ACTN|nr:hypothetical protein [Actinoplanes humidus]GIE25123.1 hypothetical protein Ahu01nite_082250 [Actinoplanes humidus]
MSTTPTNDLTAPPITRPQRSAWLPRSGGATAVLCVTALIAALPALYFVFLAFASFLCMSDSCSNTNMLYSVPFALAAVLLALSPFAAVRLYQGKWAAAPQLRLAAVLAAVLAADVLIVGGLMTLFMWYLSS